MNLQVPTLQSSDFVIEELLDNAKPKLIEAYQNNQTINHDDIREIVKISIAQKYIERTNIDVPPDEHIIDDLAQQSQSVFIIDTPNALNTFIIDNESQFAYRSAMVASSLLATMMKTIDESYTQEDYYRLAFYKNDVPEDLFSKEFYPPMETQNGLWRVLSGVGATADILNNYSLLETFLSEDNPHSKFVQNLQAIIKNNESFREYIQNKTELMEEAELAYLARMPLSDVLESNLMSALIRLKNDPPLSGDVDLQYWQTMNENDQWSRACLSALPTEWDTIGITLPTNTILTLVEPSTSKAPPNTDAFITLPNAIELPLSALNIRDIDSFKYGFAHYHKNNTTLKDTLKQFISLNKQVAQIELGRDLHHIQQPDSCALFLNGMDRSALRDLAMESSEYIERKWILNDNNQNLNPKR